LEELKRHNRGVRYTSVDEESQRKKDLKNIKQLPKMSKGKYNYQRTTATTGKTYAHFIF